MHAERRAVRHGGPDAARAARRRTPTSPSCGRAPKRSCRRSPGSSPADDVDKEEILGDVDRFADLVERGSSGFGCVIVPTWTVSPWLAGGGLTESRPGGVAWALNLANQRLMDATSGLTKVFVLDAQRWLSAAASDAYSERMWFMGKVPFDERVFERAADDIAAALTAVRGGARKLVIVDLDNTLWGGVVGDDGWESLRLGGHDSDGEAFVEFQRALQQLMRRGVLLAIVSKNDEAVALEAINRHDGMVLELDDFAGLAHQLGATRRPTSPPSSPSSTSASSRSSSSTTTRTSGPAWPRPCRRCSCPTGPTTRPPTRGRSRALSCFDSPVRSAEDASRTQLYVDRTSPHGAAVVGGLARRLDPRARHRRPRRCRSARATCPAPSQLLNKTNQMNLTTRRLTEDEFTGVGVGRPATPRGASPCRTGSATRG